MNPQTAGTRSSVRPPKPYRGSRRRLQRITLKDNWSVPIWILLLWVMFLLFVVVPWMIRHQP